MFHLSMRFVIPVLAFALWTAAGGTEAEVIIGKPEIDELFAAQYRYYQSQSAGSVSIQNNTSENLRAETSITVATYAPEPLIVSASLPAGRTTRVPLKLDFDLDKLPSQGEPLALNAEVEVSVYSENERVCQKRLPVRFQLHNLHTLSSIPPEAIAVFIDAGDQSVAEFVGGDSATAQMLFELMQQAGIICINQSSRTVRYPRELLRMKIGSSYDCALLYAALLENSNIPAALMVSDDYILILFQQQRLTEEQQRVGSVSWRGRIWTPLDIRMLKSTFSEAKASGMETYEALRQDGKVEPFLLREAWEQYKPVRFLSPQSIKEIQLGITYVLHGQLDKAEQIFNKHLNSSASAAAYNNLGNISLRRGNTEEAVRRYLEALKNDPDDGAIYLNMGLTYVVTGEDEKAAEMLDNALRVLGSYARMCYALGITLEGSEHQEVRSLLREAERRILQSRTKPLGIRARPDSDQLPLYWKRR